MQFYAFLIMLPFALSSLLCMEKPIALKRRGSTDELPQMPDTSKKKHAPTAQSLPLSPDSSPDQFENPLYRAIRERNHSYIQDILNAGGKTSPIKRILSCIENICIKYPKDGEKMLHTLIAHNGLLVYAYRTDDNQKNFLISTNMIDQDQVESVAESQKASPLTDSIKATTQAMKHLSRHESLLTP